MKNFDEFKKDVEREIMIKIIIGLRYGKISQKKAEVLAQEYTRLMQLTSADELFSQMAHIITQYTEMLEVYLKVASEYFSQKKEYVLSEARKYLQTAQYDKALAVLQGKETY